MGENRDTLVLNFVLKNGYQSEEDASSAMKDAFKSAVDFGMHCRWITESDCQQISEESRHLVFVFEDFEGQIFSRFSKSHKHSRIIGPKCLLNCMSGGIPVPNTKYPVFNLAMNGLSICTSGVPPDQKRELEKLVGYMGGTFSSKFLTTTTHLVVNSVLSEKCFKAREAGIPIMTKSWVEDVWRRNAHANVDVALNMTSEYAVPIFYNLKVTASGMLEKDKNEIRDRVRDNGGNYTPEMRKETNVLILPAGRGEKFRFAERWNIICLSPSWIECCLKKGYAVRYEDYIIKSAEKKCSTPVNTCNHMIPLMNANDSDISVIPSDSAKSVIPETQNDSPLVIRKEVFKTPVKCAPRRDGRDGSPKVGDCVNYQTLLNDTTVVDAKKCGPILDGCKVYLAGFKDNEAEKLRRILNYSGAIRYTELNDSVTHVIVGNPTKNDLEIIKAANHPLHVVNLKWLSSSIEKRMLEKESNFAHFVDDKVDKPQTSKSSQQPSPLSKKGLQMLNPVREISVTSEPAIDHVLLEKYSRTLDPVPGEVNPITERSDTANREDFTRDQTTQSSTSCNLFAGLKFAIAEYEPSAEEELNRIITEYGGFVSEEFGSVDYIIVPLEQTRRITRGGVTAEVVTSVWIQECYEENRIVEIKYHHRPLIVARPIPATSSSSHCVITFSSYTMYQRQYLEQVAKFLGARFQNVLSKREAPERDIARTTHLVCALPEGVKYNAAKKWNLPIINERWLLDSYSQRQLLPLDSYLLREDQDNEGKEPVSNVQNSQATTLEKATTNKQTAVKDAENSCRNQKVSEQVKTIAARSSYTIPELTDAIKNTDDRAFNLSGEHKRTPETKDYPAHGLLARFNRHASSIMKRKSDDENDLMAAPTVCQRRKVLCSDAARTLSSQEEGVGWQDTFTDAHSDNLQNRISNVDAAPCTSSEANRESSSNHVRRDNIENDRRLLNDNPTSGVDSAEDRRTRTNQLFRSSRPALRNMMISINNKEKKETCEAIVEGLGGKVIQRFDPDCSENERVTHLIIDELKKTEKLLCSLASGLWILHSSYLEQCKEKKEFLSEEPFEWGNPLRTSLPAITESRDSTGIAKAAYRWRRLIQAEGPSRRPFINMKAVIVNSNKDEPMQSLIRVVKSGGGQVLPMSDVLKATHCLVLSVKNADSIPVPLEQLARKKVHYLPAVYLSDCLVRDPPPPPESCYLESYKRFF